MREINHSFKDSIPIVYDRYLGPYIFEPFAVYTAGRIKGAPKHVLEIAAGTGRVTKHIVERIGHASKIIATDINPGMLDVAKSKMHASNLEFQLADAQDLPYPSNTFDCVICQFGFMFLPDRQKGFNEAWRVLKPGGQFLFSTWDRAENNITVYITQQTIKQFLKAAPPPSYGRPYSMFDPVALKSHLTIAGFTNSSIEKITLVGECPSAKDIATGFVEGNAIINEIIQEGPELLEIIKKTIASKINQQVCKDPVRSELNVWFGEAFK